MVPNVGEVPNAATASGSPGSCIPDAILRHEVGVRRAAAAVSSTAPQDSRKQLSKFSDEVFVLEIISNVLCKIISAFSRGDEEFEQMNIKGILERC